MVLLGSAVNGAVIVICGIIGAIIGSKLPERISKTVMNGMALCIVFIGIDGALSGENTLVAIISMAVGALVGELIDFYKYLTRFGDFLQSKLAKRLKGKDTKKVW